MNRTILMCAMLTTVLALPTALAGDGGIPLINESDIKSLECVGAPTDDFCLGLKNSEAGDWSCAGLYVEQHECHGVLYFPASGGGGVCVGSHSRCDEEPLG